MSARFEDDLPTVECWRCSATLNRDQAETDLMHTAVYAHSGDEHGCLRALVREVRALSDRGPREGVGGAPAPWIEPPPAIAPPEPPPMPAAHRSPAEWRVWRAATESAVLENARRAQGPEQPHPRGPLSDRKSDLEAPVDYWKRMFLRAACGCVSRDCLSHGAFDPDECDIATVARDNDRQRWINEKKKIDER